MVRGDGGVAVDSAMLTSYFAGRITGLVAQCLALRESPIIALYLQGGDDPVHHRVPVVVGQPGIIAADRPSIR